jgi:ribonucleoside-diphosphate reductase alpha chain
MAIVNQTVPRALKTMGYTKAQADEIVDYIFEHNTVVDAPHLKKEHYEVFACAVGDNAIHYLGHVKMMSAVQPFLSGAISKTVNMPKEATVEDVEQLHIDAWKMGLKAVAIYRDNSKVAQPLSGKKKEEKEEVAPAAAATPAATAEAVSDKIVVRGAVRRRLPRRRDGKTYKFSLADLEGFFTVSEYEDGTLGELFINVSKQGSTLSGLMDSFAISVSHGLQYGVPLKSYVKTLRSSSFAPSGITDDPDIRTASSITDYIFRRLALDYLSFDDRLELGLASLDDMPDDQQTMLLTDDRSTEGQLVTAEKPQASEEPAQPAAQAQEVPKVAAVAEAKKPSTQDSTAPLCYNCGNQTQRAGSCYVCSSCGSTTGCS